MKYYISWQVVIFKDKLQDIYYFFITNSILKALYYQVAYEEYRIVC